MHRDGNERGHSVGTKPFVYKAVGPGSATDIATATVWVQQVVFANPTGGALTVSMKDRGGTAWELYNALSVAANTSFVASFNPPLRFDSGINFNAGATMDVQIHGLQKAG